MATYTNREFARDDELFKMACGVVELKPSKRQASKWRRGFGIAYEHGRRKAQQILAERKAEEAAA